MSETPTTVVNNSTEDTDRYLTPDEACKLLAIERSWLYDQVQAGRIPYAKFGRQLRFNRGQLLAWARDQWK